MVRAHDLVLDPEGRAPDALGPDLLILGGEDRDAAPLGRGVVFVVIGRDLRAHLLALMPVQGRAGRDQQTQAAERRLHLFGQVEQPPQQGGHEEHAVGAGARDLGGQRLGRIRGRAEHEGRAQHDLRQRKGAPAAEIERRGGHEPVVGVEGQRHGLRHEPREHPLMRHHRSGRPPGGPGGQRYQQRKVRTTGQRRVVLRRHHRRIPGRVDAHDRLAVHRGDR